jgi:hypothetical protein
VLHVGGLLLMNPYRDGIEAARARERELDDAIAEAQAERAGLRFERTISWVKWLAATAMVVTATAWWLRWTAPPLRVVLAPVSWQARVIAATHLRVGTECEVQLSEGCQATVRCGSFGYRGRGSCDTGRYVDNGFHGTPQAEIEQRSGHVMLRQISYDNAQRLRESWSVELVRE